MLKNKNIKKIKFITTFFGISAMAGIAATVASCAGPSSQTLKNIFTPSSNIDSFTNSSNGSINNVFTNGILQSDGYQVLLKDKISEILGIWYSKNQDSSFKNKYENFVDDANDDWKSKVTDYQKQYGNDYQVKLQTDVLDPVGGTKENWIQDQINQKVLDDFTNQVFAKSFLNYTDDLGNIISNPQADTIKNKDNWKNIQFTADNSSTNNISQIDNQVFAQLQNFVFDKWVELENPNLVSRIVFTNDQPQNGLKEIFNQNVIGSDNLSPSYEYQAFKNNLNDPTDAKGMNAYKTISQKGLSSYFDPANDTIDIPNIFSSDSGGKLLMTASDMFNTYDVAFTSAFVYQYLRMLGLDTEANSTVDKISNKVKQPSASSTDVSQYNIMNNFIIHDVSLGAGVSKRSESEYTSPNKQYNNIVDPGPSGFYNVYANLNLKNTYIFNVSEPIPSDSTTDSTGSTSSTSDPNNIYSQFIFTRGKDGVHIIAIDGGKYYLDSTTHQRDISKQEEFLKFRAYLANLYNGSLQYNSDGYPISYTFDLNSQLKDWFNAHQVSLLYQFLNAQSADTTGTTIFSNNPDLKLAFDNFRNEFGDYINAFILYNQVLNLQSDIDVMRSKLNSWAQTYSDYVKNYTPAKIGIAAKLPYVRENDGDYFGLIQYYLEILNLVDNTTKSAPSSGATSNISISFNDNEIRGKTRKLFADEVKSKYQELTVAANELVKSLDLQPSNRIQYSQNLFIQSNKDSSLYLALNLVINATLASDPVTSSIKIDYLENSNDFKQIFTDDKINDTPIINSNGDKLSAEFLSKAIKNFYQQSAWSGLSDKTIYGNFIDLKDLNDKVDLAWKNQLGVSAYSSNKLSYDLLLYTVYYLLKDNLANFKAILSSQIYQGVDALVSWTVPTNPASTNNPITNFEANPNYIQGAGWNKQSTTTPPSSTWDNTWFNTSITSTSTNSMNSNPFNDSSNFYNYTSVADTSGTYTNLYGFNGISTNNDTSNLDSNVADAMFKNYATSGSVGSLYSFGSKADLLDYIKNINNQKILDNLVKRLSQANIVVADYYQQDANGKDVYNFAQKKEIIENVVNSIPADYFTAFTGFIGGKKIPVTPTETAADFLHAYQKSEPVNESGDSKLTVIAALMKQINYKDVANLGTGNWWLKTDPGTGRLGLDLSTFLALVVQQAQDSVTQSQAISYLIQNNNIGEKGSKIISGDKRIYDALGSNWTN